MVSPHLCLAAAKFQINHCQSWSTSLKAQNFQTNLSLNCTAASISNYCKKFVLLKKSRMLLIRAILHTQDLEMVWVETSPPNQRTRHEPGTERSTTTLCKGQRMPLGNSKCWSRGKKSNIIRKLMSHSHERHETQSSKVTKRPKELWKWLAHDGVLPHCCWWCCGGPKS